MDSFLDYLATKRGMAGALHAVLTDDDDLRMKTRGLLIDAIGTLLAAGMAEGTIRPDADPTVVVMGLGGVALIAGQPDQRDLARDLLDLLMDGLRYAAGAQVPRHAWALGLQQFLAHERHHRVVAGDGSVGRLLVPRVGFATVSTVAESLVERARSRVAVLDAKLNPVQPAGQDPLLGRVHEEGADAARLQSAVHGQLPDRARAGRPGVVNPAECDREAGWRTGGQVLHLAEPDALERPTNARQVGTRPRPAA